MRVPVELVPPVVELEGGVVVVDVESPGNVDGGNNEACPDAKDNIRKNKRIETMGEENLSLPMTLEQLTVAPMTMFGYIYTKRIQIKYTSTKKDGAIQDLAR